MEHVGKQKGRWRFTLKPIAERADFSNKTVGLNQKYVHPYIYMIYLDLSQYPQSPTTGHFDNVTTFAEPWLPQLTSFTSTPSCTAKVVDKREKQTGCFATSNQHHGSQISTTFHIYSGEILWCFHMIIYYPHE